MSLSNRYGHPFERWMNNLVRREMDHWRAPSKSMKSGHKGSSKGGVIPYDDWEMPMRDMGPWNRSLMNPWGNFEEPWMTSTWSSMPRALPFVQTESTVNDKGQLELRMRMPRGIEESDIHLEFESGGLHMTANKTEQHSHKSKHGQGNSTHQSHVSVSHFWPLDKGIKESDIEANFLDEDGILEVTINQPHKQVDRPKGMPIAIGHSSHKTNHAMLDAGAPMSELYDNVKSKVADSASSASNMASNVKSKVADSASNLKSKISESGPVQAVTDQVKNAASELKKFKDSEVFKPTKAEKDAYKDPSSTSSTSKKPVVGPDAPQMPGMDEM